MRKPGFEMFVRLCYVALLCLTPFPSNARTQEAAKPFVVTESAFTIETTSISSTGLWMWWTAVFKNPNPGYYCAHPQVTVTARNSSGEVVGTYEKSMVAFFTPAGTIAYGDNLEVLEVPAKLEITPAKCYWTKLPTGIKPLPEFQARNVRLIPIQYRLKVSGEVINPLSQDIDSVMGAVLFRDQSGKLLGGDLFYIKNIPAQATKPFMDDLLDRGAIPRRYDKFEFMVFPTSLINYDRLLQP